MDSAYQKLQSNPYHKDHTHYGPYYQGNVTAPPQMFMNPPQPAPVHGCWPWGSNYGYGSPAACQGCCNHSYWPPHYAWGSPYFNVPPYHFPGSCHPYPIQYMTPSGYSVEPRYEYEKIPPGVQHCCGCPHHPPPQKEQRGVRIEEEEPDGERGMRKIDDSLSPFQFSNQPNPVVWLPPGYGTSSNNESKKESRRFEKPGQNRKIADAEQPSFLNGWYPLDLSKLVSSKHGRDGERNDGQLDDDVKGRFPFPVVWMPDKPDQKEKEDHNGNGAIAQPQLGLEGSCDDQNSTMNEEKSGGQTTVQERGMPVMKVAQHGDQENLKNASGGGHIPRLKDIPVKEIRQHEDMGSPVKNSTDDGEKKKLDNNRVKKSAKDGAAGKSPSPPRSSKLPPVCLRVDPLPKRKSAKGRSRSPSPPGEKQQPDKASNEANGVLSSSVNKKLDYINQKESKQGKGTTKNVEVVDGKTQKGESVTIIREPPISTSANSQEAPEKAQTEKNPAKDNGTSCKVTEPDDAVVSDPSESAGFAKVENPELVGSEELVTADSKKKLSEKEAAVIIQSVYRGFDVRRWEPIKKLKQIANVRDLTAEVKHLIQSLESSSSDSKSKSKQKTIIGETIMSLLLKLDTIQGLHPSIREIRKSVVRELVNLQEKLDSMKDENPETGPSQESVEGHEGDPCLNQLDGGSKPESSGTTEFNRNEVEANAAGENCTNKEQGSAPPTTEGDQSDVQNETSMSKEDHEGLVLEQSYVTSEVNPVEDKANGKVADEVSVCSMGKESAMDASTGNDKEASEVVDDESSKDRRRKNLRGQSSELPLLQVDSGEATLEEGTALTENAQDVCDDHSDGELSMETSVPNPTGEDGEKVTAESFMTQESAAELFEDMNNEAHVNDEISMLKKHDHEDHILHKSPEVPPLRTGSSHATDSVPGETDAGEGCDICAQESPNHMEFESSTLLVDTVDRETDVNVVDTGSETRESNLSEFFDSCKFEGAMEDETRITGGVPGDCAAPQPVNTIAGVFEDLEASETVGSCSRIDSSGNTSHEEPEEIEVNNTISEVSPDSSAAHGMDNEAIVLVKKADEGEPGVDQIEPVNCTDNEAIVLVKKADEGEPDVDQIEPANCTDNEVIVLVKKADEGESGVDQIEPVNCTMSEKSIEVEPKEVHACEESATPDGVVALSDVVEQEDPTEKNRKLMEENERLREVMGELMRSGKEQVRAITTLSRRVKDLEKRLSRKKKVKVKQHPKATTGSVKPIDGC